MTRTLAKTLVALGFVASMTAVYAQNDAYNDPPIDFIGWSYCIDPSNTAPYSTDWAINSRATNLFRCSIGGSGTVTYGGQNSPCFTTAHSYNSQGRIGFASGPVGSYQDDFEVANSEATQTVDDDMVYTFGMPSDPAGDWGCAWIITMDPATSAQTTALFGTSITGEWFAGYSGHYIHMENTANSVQADLRMDVLGDGAREVWSLQNVGTAAQDIGVWQGGQLAILQDQGGDPVFPDSGLFGDPVYVVLPGRKPLVIETRITRAADPANFPAYAQFCYGQTSGYGLEVELGPTYSTTDLNGNSDATLADELVVGGATVIGDPINANTVNPPGDFIFTDLGLQTDQFLVKWQPASGGSVGANQTRTVITYWRNTWGNSKYIRTDVNGNPELSVQPYTTVVDAPHLLPQDQGGGSNGLSNNPFDIRVYVDNTGGYSQAYVGVDIDDVEVHLSLPAGLSMYNNDSPSKIITQIHPQDMGYVDFLVQADGITIGDLPYEVTINSTPGPSASKPITHDGVIRVSATPQIPVVPNANLMSVPWTFTDSSWEAVLAPLTIPNDFTVYDWDPVQNSYVTSTAATRGVGHWFILNPTTHPAAEVEPYTAAATPTDMLVGYPNIELYSGWNLIGDPYPYAIPVSQLVGVSAANPALSFSFADLVAQGAVSPYLAYWDTSVSNYRYVQGQAAMLQPNQGYWIRVQTSQNLTLNYPPVYDTFVPGGKASGSSQWVQAANHFRANLVAQSNYGKDTENYVGVATGSDNRLLQIPKPPMGPGGAQDLNVSVDGSNFGQSVPLAQALYSRTGSLSWTVRVQSAHSGPVTLSWPNMATIPNGITFRLVDGVTHQSYDMRKTSQYTFTGSANGTRTFTVQSTSSSTVLPTIASLTTTAGRLTGKVSAGIYYTLNYAAGITLNILDSKGNLVNVLQNNVNESKGNHFLGWNLKTSSGGYVPAGTYEVQAVAPATNERKETSVTVGR
ncbi:MAG TPA: FlgD immunoglobulin-like domain containing protein [Fimbriimonadaceae bacterium]|nr:FlgD immunoglobulin-like domain containing protein [Fimbriimonadaceae bacterium]